MTSLQPVVQPEPPDPQYQPAKSKAANMIGGVPGTVVAILTALTTAIGAYTQYQEGQAIQRSAYEAIKMATDRNTADLAKISEELSAGRVWMQSIERAVRELQQMSHDTERTEMSEAPDFTLPPARPKLPTFDQIKK